MLCVCIYVAPWCCEARHFVPLYVPTCSGMTIKLNLNLNLNLTWLVCSFCFCKTQKKTCIIIIIFFGSYSESHWGPILFWTHKISVFCTLHKSYRIEITYIWVNWQKLHFGCNQCCQIWGFPVELGYLYTVAAGCFLVCRLKQSTWNVIMTDEENCRKKMQLGYFWLTIEMVLFHRPGNPGWTIPLTNSHNTHAIPSKVSTCRDQCKESLQSLCFCLHCNLDRRGVGPWS